jgi:hypothetical protein
MQDFSLIRLSSNVCVCPPLLPLSEEDMDKMESEPQSMYMYSLRTHKRLPDRLHEAMLLHSFSAEHRLDVQMYLQWVSACEERDARMDSFKRSESFRDRVIIGSMILVSAAYVTLAFALVF